MTATHPLRRLLARICSADTMARIVDPTLADMRVERGRAAWRGYVALARALALNTVLSANGGARRLWQGDEHALPRALAICAGTTILFCAPLIALPAKDAARISWRAMIFLLPQALALAVPASLLVAIPLAFNRAAASRWSLVRGLIVSALCALATLVLITRAIPDANQSFRVEVLKRLEGHVPTRQIDVPRGPMELTMANLRDELDSARANGNVQMARRLEYAYHLRLMISAMALPLGMLALALSATSLGRRRPWAAVGVGIGCYLLVLFPLERVAQTSLEHSTMPPALLVWLPLVTIAFLALVIPRAHVLFRHSSPEHAR